VVFVLTGTGVATLTAASGNTGKVYTGKEIKNAYGSNSITGAVALTLAGSNANVACLYDTTDGFTYAKVAVINTTGALVINSGSSYGYLVSNAYETKEDGTTYTNLKFWNGSENVEAKWEKSGVLDLYKSGVIITYDTVDSETVKNVSVVDATVGVVKGWDGTKKIQLDSISREISSDTVVLVVDSKNKKGVVGDASSIQIGEDTDADDVADQANVRYVTGATYVDLIVVDTSNKMYAAPVVTIAASSLNDASALTTAFKNADKIIVDEAYQIPSGVTIASGKTLEVTGALTQSGSTIVNGTLIASGTATLSANVTGTGTLKVVNFTDAATSAAFAQTSTVNITGSVTAATLEAVPVVEGKTLIVGAQSSDNGSASKWYSAAGSAATEGSNGVAGTDTISSSKIQAGTYVGTTVYSGGTDATGTAAWVKQ
jgi:hypothetical protein